MQPLLINDLSFRYPHKSIFEHASLSVEKGDFAYIVGRNGTGKSTLVKLILGLLQPDNGSIQVFGLPPSIGNRLIGYTPQYIRFDDQFPVTVKDVVMMGRFDSRKLFYSKEDKIATDEILERLGIEDLKTQSFSALSGGQRQKVLIARSMVTNPQMLILDEPTSALDAHSETKLFEILEDISKRIPIMIVSHDLYFTPPAVNKVICLETKSIQIHKTSNIPEFIRQRLHLGAQNQIEHNNEGGNCDV